MGLGGASREGMAWTQDLLGSGRCHRGAKDSSENLSRKLGDLPQQELQINIFLVLSLLCG